MQEKAIVTMTLRPKLTHFSLKLPFPLLLFRVPTTPLQHRRCSSLGPSFGSVARPLYVFYLDCNILLHAEWAADRQWVTITVICQASVTQKHWNAASMTLLLPNVPIPRLFANNAAATGYGGGVCTFFDDASVSIQIVHRNSLPFVKRKVLPEREIECSQIRMGRVRTIT